MARCSLFCVVHRQNITDNAYLADGAGTDPVADGYEVVRVPHILGLLGLHPHEAISILAADLPLQHLHRGLDT